LRERTTKTVEDVWTAYRHDREKDGKLVKNFDWDWKALKPRFGSMEVDAITADVCRAYAVERIEAGKSVGTVWTELTRLRSCINWAFKRRIIPSSPYVWVPTKPEPKQRVMSEEEVLALLDACKVPHIRLFVILAITTSARSAAICQLKWSQVDFDAGSIDLRTKETPNVLTKRTGKGRAEVPMTAEARAALLEAKKGALSDWVIEWDGEPVKKVRKGFQAAVDAAKLEGVTPHTLRHTVLTWLDEDGIPIERISKLAGHRDVNTTRKIYSKPGVGVLKPAADVIDMRLRRKTEPKQ
jgi:integrase